jgi:adenylate kinase family enzyme
LLGSPGAGKSTQAGRLAKHFGVPLVSSGELLRREAATDTESGRSVRRYLNRGELVPDKTVVARVSEALAHAMKEGGYVLEGFPRTAAQAEQVEAAGMPDAVVYLDLPDDVARARLSHREDARRTDDADDSVIERRIGQFHRDIDPLLDYYRRRDLLTTIDANQAPDVVNEEILNALGKCSTGD